MTVLVESALAFALRVIDEELEVRLDSFCLRRADGGFDESELTVQERRLVRECRTAIKKIKVAMEELKKWKRI